MSDTEELEIELDLSSFQAGPDGISPGILQSILNSAAAAADVDDLPSYVAPLGAASGAGSLPRSSFSRGDPQRRSTASSVVSVGSNGESVEPRWENTDSEYGDGARGRGQGDRDGFAARSVASSVRSRLPTQPDGRTAEELAECTFQPKLSKVCWGSVRVGGWE